MRASSNIATLSVFVAIVNGLPRIPGFANHHYKPIPPIKSGSTLSSYIPSGLPTYHMPIPTGVSPTGVYPTGVYPTGVFPTGVYPTGVFPTSVLPTGVYPTGVFPTGYGPGSTGLPSTLPGGPLGTDSGLPPVSTSDNSPTYTTSSPSGATCPPVPEITVTQTETATLTVTVGGGAPFPTGGTAYPIGGTGALPTGTGSIVPPISAPSTHY